MTNIPPQTEPEDNRSLEERVRDLKDQIRKRVGPAPEDRRILLEKLEELRDRVKKQVEQVSTGQFSSGMTQQNFHIGGNAYFGSVPGQMVPGVSPIQIRPPAPAEQQEDPNVILSHFDFARIDPEQNSMIGDVQSLLRYSKQSLQLMRDEAVRKITEKLHGKPLFKMPYFGESYGLRDFLVVEGFFEGRIHVTKDRLDILTANVLVLQKALEPESGILQVHGAGESISFSPGKSLVFYMKQGGADDQIIAYRQHSKGELEALNPRY